MQTSPRHLRPSQRLHHRVQAPLQMTIEGKAYKAENWSLGGVLLPSIPSCAQGKEVAATVELPFQDANIAFETHVRCIRGMPHQTAFMFENLCSRKRDLLSLFTKELLTGEMVAMNDVICRMDAPVTPVVLEGEKPAPAPFHRQPLKSRLFSVLYLLMGFLLAGYFATLIYGNFFKLEVTSAVVSAPVQPVSATATGRVFAQPVPLHTFVKRGSTLLTLEDLRLEREIDQAFLAAESEIQKAAQTEERLSKQEAYLSYRIFLAEKEYERLVSLSKSGATSLTEAERAQAAMLSLEAERADIMSTLKDMRTLLKNPETAPARQAYTKLLEHRARLQLMAPTDGKLIKMLRPVGSTVEQGDIIAVFERDETRHIEAFLTQDEVLHVGLGDAANVYFPAIDQHMTATVEFIDRTDRFVDETQPSYISRTEGERTARAVLTTSNPLPEAGLPAVIVFDRRSAQGSWW